MMGMGGTWLVWTSFVISEVLSVLVSVVFMRKVNKNIIQTINQELAYGTYGKQENRKSKGKAKKVLTRVVSYIKLNLVKYN